MYPTLKSNINSTGRFPLSALSFLESHISSPLLHIKVHLQQVEILIYKAVCYFYSLYSKLYFNSQDQCCLNTSYSIRHPSVPDSEPDWDTDVEGKLPRQICFPADPHPHVTCPPVVQHSMCTNEPVQTNDQIQIVTVTNSKAACK